MIKDGLLLNSVIGSAKFKLHLIPISNKTSRPRIKMLPKYITIHNTGNSKADALANSKYVDTATGYVSWHFTVDDKMIYQELPINEVAWHAGDGNGPGNMQSIGIEICEHQGINWEKAKANAVALIIILMQELNIPLSNVVPHQKWSGKYCPHKILDEGWDKFISLIKKESDKNMDEKVSDYAQTSWEKAIKKGIQDGKGAKNNVTEEQLMVFFDKLGLLD